MSIIEHVTLQKIVAHDFRYDPRIIINIVIIIIIIIIKSRNTRGAQLVARMDRHYMFILIKSFSLKT